MPETSIALRPASMPTLYDVETDLLALLDTESMVTPEQDAAYRNALMEQMAVAQEKRDHVAGFIKMCEYQAAAAGEEIKRMQARKKGFANAADRMREYVVWALDQLQEKKLTGRNFTLSTRACPASLEITDSEQIPDDFRTVTVTMSLHDWRLIISDYGEVPGCSVDFGINTELVKTALQRGETVDGADLVMDKKTCQIR